MLPIHLSVHLTPSAGGLDTPLYFAVIRQKATFGRYKTDACFLLVLRRAQELLKIRDTGIIQVISYHRGDGHQLQNTRAQVLIAKNDAPRQDYLITFLCRRFRHPTLMSYIKTDLYEGYSGVRSIHLLWRIIQMYPGIIYHDVTCCHDRVVPYINKATTLWVGYEARCFGGHSALQVNRVSFTITRCRSNERT